MKTIKQSTARLSPFCFLCFYLVFLLFLYRSRVRVLFQSFLFAWVSFSHARERAGAMSTFVFDVALLLLFLLNKSFLLLLTEIYFSVVSSPSLLLNLVTPHTHYKSFPSTPPSLPPSFPPSLRPSPYRGREGGKEGFTPTPAPAATPAPPPRCGHKTRHATDASPLSR